MTESEHIELGRELFEAVGERVQEYEEDVFLIPRKGGIYHRVEFAEDRCDCETFKEHG